MIFKRVDLNKLYNEYQKSISIAEELRKTYKNIPYKNIKERVDLAKKIFDYYNNAFNFLIKFIYSFSPSAANSLKKQICSFKKLSEESLNRDYISYFRSYNVKPSADLIIESTNKTIDNLMRFLDLYKLFFNFVIITIFETLERTRGKPPIELNEYIKEKLEKVDKTCAKLYEGAWEAFHSENPDRYRHLSVSLRELLRKLLGNTQSEMKQRMMDISGSNTTSSFIVSLANSIVKLHETLSKGVHQEIDEETALLSLRIMECIIEYLDRKGQLK